MTRKLAMGLSVLMVLFLLGGGLSAQAPVSTEKVTLKIGYQEGGYGIDFLTYAIRTFQNKYPNVTIKLTNSPDLGTVVSTLAQAGNNADMFDIFTGEGPYAAAGKLEPINDILESTFPDNPKLKVKDGLYKGVYETLSKNTAGEIFRLPRAIYVGGLFYDKAFFQKNKWNENPKTYAEFLKLMDSIKAKNVVPMTFSGMYNYIGFSVWWNKAFELAELNGTLDKVKGDFMAYRSPRYDTPEMRTLYTRLYEMGKKGYFSKGLSALDHTASQMLMLQNKVALVSTADWVENEMKSSGAVPENFQWGFMTIPMGSKATDTIWLNNGDSDSAVIWKDKPELSKAWSKEFLKWTLTVDVQRNMAKVAGAMPVRAAFYDSKTNLDSLTSSQKAISSYMASHKTRLENNFTVTPKVGPSDAQADKLFVESVPLICQGELDPLPVLKQAEALFQKGLEEGKALQ